MRYPSVAGAFYDSRPSSLRTQIERSFKHRLGHGSVPKLAKGGKREIKGAVVPHAGYVYSGPVASHVYGALAEDGFPRTFVILGPNHHGSGSGVAITKHDFEMPMGIVKVNQELASQIMQDLVDDDIFAHRQEHSIEVQLPFLQYFTTDFDFVPISMWMQEHDDAIRVGKIVGNAIQGKDVVVLASSDFTHCGLSYGCPVPAGMSAGKFAEENDRHAIEKILALDTKQLDQARRKRRMTVCGYGPITAMIQASIINGAKRAELLKYATSYDIQPAESAVGYGAIILK